MREQSLRLLNKTDLMNATIGLLVIIVILLIVIGVIPANHSQPASKLGSTKSINIWFISITN